MKHLVPLPAYLPTGQIAAVDVAGQALALVRVAGEWHVFRDFCPHEGCSFSGQGSIEDGEIVCHCHFATFDLVTGARRRGPVFAPVEVFPTTFDGTRLEVELP